MTDRPSVTVIIPSYNTPEQYLHECLRSLQEQTVRDWEAIVVEDGPGQGDVEHVVEELSDPRVRFVRHETNRGMGAARNTACRMAQADLLLTLDADDRLLPLFIERTVQALRQDRRANCVLVDLQEFGTSRNIFRFPVPLPPPCPQHPVFADGGVLMKRSLWEAVGGYTEDSCLRGFEWWDFWIRAVQVGFHATHVPEPLYLYRRHSDAIGLTRMYHERRIREVLYRRHKGFFDVSLTRECRLCGPRASIAAFIAQGYVISSLDALSRGERLRAIGMALRGFMVYPWSWNTVRQVVRSVLPEAVKPTIRRARRSWFSAAKEGRG